MTPAQAAASHGVTIIEMATAWGVKRRAIEMMFYAHPHRFHLIADGLSRQDENDAPTSASVDS